MFDVVDRSGSVRDGSARVWPQTEAIKAHLVMADGAAASRAIIGNLFERFIAGNPAGTWTEHLSADGAAKSDRIPSSTLYHIVLGVQRARADIRKATAPGRA